MTAQEKQSVNASEPYAGGSPLQKLRQEKLLKLEDVNQATRISLANLRAIESMEYEKLPADIFTRGQIALYGDFLGLDGRQVAKQFFIDRNGGKETDALCKKNRINHSLTPKQLAEPAHISSATIAGFLLLLIVLSFTGFCLYTSWNPFAFVTTQVKVFSPSANDTFHPADPATGSRINRKNLSLNVHPLKDAQVTLSLDNKESS